MSKGDPSFLTSFPKPISMKTYNEDGDLSVNRPPSKMTAPAHIDELAQPSNHVTMKPVTGLSDAQSPPPTTEVNYPNRQRNVQKVSPDAEARSKVNTRDEHVLEDADT